MTQPVVTRKRTLAALRMRSTRRLRRACQRKSDQVMIKLKRIAPNLLVQGDVDLLAKDPSVIVGRLGISLRDAFLAL